MSAFGDVVGKVRDYAKGQDQDADAHVTQDGFDVLGYSWDLKDARRAVEQATGLVESGGEVTLRLPVDGGVVVLTSDRPDIWLPEDDGPEAVLPHLAESPTRLSWTTADLLAGDSAAGFGAVTGGTAEVGLSKERWQSPIEEQTGRSVWIGLSVNDLAGWLQTAIPEQIAQKLFGAPGALVLLANWSEDVFETADLAIGDLDHVPSAGVDDDDVLVARLEGRSEHDRLPDWRLIGADLSAAPAALAEPLRQAAGLTAARLLAEVQDADEVRPSATQPTRWKLAATPGEADGEFTALIGLVRWVGEDLSEARLQVARELAAERIKDPAHQQDERSVLEAAKLAYRLHVRQDVLQSLERQQTLEDAFRDLDDRAAEMRAKLGDALDDALTKGMAGALTIAIASLASAKVRDWPATIAGVVLACYLFIAAANVALLRRDSVKRLNEAAKLAKGRLEGLGDSLVRPVEQWKRALERRARFAFWVLFVAAIAVLAGGIAQNSEITSRDDTATATPTTTETSPTAGSPEAR